MKKISKSKDQKKFDATVNKLSRKLINKAMDTEYIEASIDASCIALIGVFKLAIEVSSDTQMLKSKFKRLSSILAQDFKEKGEA